MFQIFLVVVGKLGIDLLHPPVGNHIFTGSPGVQHCCNYEWEFYELEIYTFFKWLKKRITIPGLTWCRSRRRSSLSPRQGQGLEQGAAGPAPGSPGRA